MVEAGKQVDKDATKAFIDEHWDSWFVQGLSDFIRIPNLTPMVDEEFLTNGLIDRAIDHVDEYAKKLDIKGMTRHRFQPEGMPPMIIYVVEANGSESNVMLYGHLDKQASSDPDKGVRAVGNESAFTALLAIKAL